jgi:hypothetical protein
MTSIVLADRIAVHELIGCQGAPRKMTETSVVFEELCPWEGVVEVQYYNADGPAWRACRAHAAPFRADDDFRVWDSGRRNRLLIA